MPVRIPRIEPGDAEDAGLDDDGPPHLAGRHSGRPEHADLADALEDVHRERVDDAEGRDDDRDDRQRVEQAEDAAERGVDGARDAVERVRLEGQVTGGLSSAGRASASRPGR